jgi:two-component system, LuxR family, response regulator FixJ
LAREERPVAQGKQVPAVEATTNDQIDLRGPVCVVDNDNLVCDSVTVLLETYGFAVLPYASGAQFLGDERRVRAKCLIIDQHMPGMNGLDVVAALHRERAFLPTILMTGRLDTGIARRAGELGVRAILEKPFRAPRLVDLVCGALDLLD